jgi:hypothetical protein
VQFFQSVMYHYSEEWGGLLRGMGRPIPRSGAAYSEEWGGLFRGEGRTPGKPASAVAFEPSYSEEWGVPSGVFRAV